MNLLEPCTQQEFGDLVGISRQAVSEHLANGVMVVGDSAAAWLLDYCDHIREHAAGRGADGALASNRAEESRLRGELLEIRLAERRGEVVPVTVVGSFIAHIGSQIRDHLQALPVQLKMRCPNLSGEDLKIVETNVSEALNMAANMSLASLDAMDKEVEN